MNTSDDENERLPVQIEITTGELTVIISGPKLDAYEAAQAFAFFDCPTFESPRMAAGPDLEIVP